ncbi:unnamed protein product [Linum tenue]|uniref:Uncharacterized protein n=1 Tax=Linum tenue TaxID=586396 RepID=A0AAV0RX69_9ROSI|nr:unnamed protein product [Linum tenue]
MESPEPPECPVCLQPYDGDDIIPRVLPCGHTVCETCLNSLPERYNLTVRCPACTQLVKFPSPQGPSSLPKNIDLLRLIPTTNSHQDRSKFKASELQNDAKVDDFLPRLWSHEFYSEWRKWVLPDNAVSVEDKGLLDGFLKEHIKVRLFKVAGDSSDGDGKDCMFKLSYIAKIMNCLFEMNELKRRELGLILKIGSERSRICRVRGLWGDLDDGCLYCVCERLNESSWSELWCLDDGVSIDGVSSFVMVGMEMCEAVMSLHLEGVIAGGLGLPCFTLDDFGHVSLCSNQVLALGQTTWKEVSEFVRGGKSVGNRELGTLVAECLRRGEYLSPEALGSILLEGYVPSVAYRSDVWSLAFTFARLLVGEQFTKDMLAWVDDFISETSEKVTLDCAGLYMGLMEKTSHSLESKYGEKLQPLQQLLCRCLNFDIENRPDVIEMWKCIREVIIRGEFDTSPRLINKVTVGEGATGHCLVTGELCQVAKVKSEMNRNNKILEEGDTEGVENADEFQETGIDFVEGLVEGKVKSKNLQGHFDCITGLAIGGGFLFSSSFDKTVCVWSLQDFSHVHTLKGHEHKVMAVIYSEEGQKPLCISGDSGGGIFLWTIHDPLDQTSLRKWYEEKDWRYSGIHALTTAGNGYLYSGSGDRSIKAWVLQDGTLSCTMEGHKSVVSTLAARNGVLYSGSWDGTVRLWSLSDHSLLTVLGEKDMPGTLSSVLSVTADRNLVISTHENGHLKVWRNDQFMKSAQIHSGAIFSSSMGGGWLFTGGWDKTVNVQELSGDELQVDIKSIGTIPSTSVITALLYWQGKLYVGYGDRTIKVFCYAN